MMPCSRHIRHSDTLHTSVPHKSSGALDITDARLKNVTEAQERLVAEFQRVEDLEVRFDTAIRELQQAQSHIKTMTQTESEMALKIASHHKWKDKVELKLESLESLAAGSDILKSQLAPEYCTCDICRADFLRICSDRCGCRGRRSCHTHRHRHYRPVRHAHTTRSRRLKHTPPCSHTCGCTFILDSCLPCSGNSGGGSAVA